MPWKGLTVRVLLLVHYIAHKLAITICELTLSHKLHRTGPVQFLCDVFEKTPRALESISHGLLWDCPLFEWFNYLPRSRQAGSRHPHPAHPGAMLGLPGCCFPKTQARGVPTTKTLRRTGHPELSAVGGWVRCHPVVTVNRQERWNPAPSKGHCLPQKPQKPFQHPNSNTRASPPDVQRKWEIKCEHYPSGCLC